MVGPNAHYLTFNQFDKLKQGVAWAGKYGLKVWVDLHGVPGSQNGYDNGGRVGPIHWGDREDYYRRTLATHNKLVAEFTQPDYRGVVTAIQPVNEPAANRNGNVKQLLNRVSAVVRCCFEPIANLACTTVLPCSSQIHHQGTWKHSDGSELSDLGDEEEGEEEDGDDDDPCGMQVWAKVFTRRLTRRVSQFHDGFLTPSYWENFFTEEQRKRTVLDTHPYYVYSPEQKAAKDSARLREVCSAASTFRQSQSFYPTIAGEMAPSGPNGDRGRDRDLSVGPVKFPAGQGPKNGGYDYSVRVSLRGPLRSLCSTLTLPAVHGFHGSQLCSAKVHFRKW